MVNKIFAILEGVKKSSNITKQVSTNAIDSIVNEVNSGNINPVEAYVMLDYIQKVTADAIKGIKSNALNYIMENGENRAFGTELQLIKRNDFSYEEDADWSKTHKILSNYKDALKAREEFIKEKCEYALRSGLKPEVSYTSSVYLRTKQLS